MRAITAVDGAITAATSILNITSLPMDTLPIAAARCTHPAAMDGTNPAAGGAIPQG
ncbi:MAG TPA: hypothetical protein VMS37_19520 [Verrucomicrobiae bacterium]|nr:hypothetical protein [Verrucomicrobiae bacterium]